MTYRGNNEFFFLSRGQYNRIAQIILNNAKEKTMTDTKHTPTPLRVEDCVIYWNDKRVAIALEGDVGRGAAIYNAAHIVKCVNMHEELVEVINDLLQCGWFASSGSNDRALETLKKAGAL